MANVESDEKTTAARLAAVEAELARSKPRTRNSTSFMAAWMIDPVPTGYSAELSAKQAAARRAAS